MFSISLLCTISLIANVFVLNLHHKNIELCAGMPRWVKFIQIQFENNSFLKITIKVL